MQALFNHPDLYFFSGREMTYLSLSIVCLLGMTIVFFLMTMFYRAGNSSKANRWSKLEERWSGIILDVLSGAKEPEELSKIVLKKDIFFFLDFLERYAKRLRGEELELIYQVAKPFADSLVERIKRGDATQRARSIRTLSKLSINRYQSLFVESLSDPSPLVTMMASRILLKNPTSEITTHILSQIDRMDWNIRYLSNMLVQGGTAIIPFLRETLADQAEAPRKRTIVCEALRLLNDIGSIQIAQTILENEEEGDAELLASSLRLIADLGFDKSLPQVLKYCDSSNVIVRINAFRALSRLCDDSHFIMLQNAIDDPSIWVAFHAVRGLKSIVQRYNLDWEVQSNHPRENLIHQVMKEGLE